MLSAHIIQSLPRFVTILCPSLRERQVDKMAIIFSDQLWIACQPTGKTRVQHRFQSHLRIIFSFVLSQIRKNNNIHQYDSAIMRT